MLVLASVARLVLAGGFVFWGAAPYPVIGGSRSVVNTGSLVHHLVSPFANPCVCSNLPQLLVWLPHLFISTSYVFPLVALIRTVGLPAY